MSASRPAIRPLAAMDQAALLALNNAHATELNWLPPERLAQMLGIAFYARGFGDVDAALIAFDQDSAYDGRHFAWFRARYPRFVYIDRVVVAPAARGQGFATALYEDVFAAAVAQGHMLVTAEVNVVPPNPASLAFHASCGFAPIADSGPQDDGRTVRYFSRALP
jgi:predicted GNAT superfamily acetyltransferase